MLTRYDITLAQAADAPAIAELSRDAIESGLSWRWTPARVMRCIRDESVNAIVVRPGGSLHGFALMKYGEDEAHILLFAVRAMQRRAGVGAALLAWLEATAEVAGILRIRLEARAGNAAARSFYRHHGFTDAGSSPGYYEGVEDAVRMVKELSVRP